MRLFVIGSRYYRMGRGGCEILFSWSARRTVRGHSSFRCHRSEKSFLPPSTNVGELVIIRTHLELFIQRPHQHKKKIFKRKCVKFHFFFIVCHQCGVEGDIVDCLWFFFFFILAMRKTKGKERIILFKLLT